MKAIAREHGMAERQEQEQINNQRALGIRDATTAAKISKARNIKKNRIAFDSTEFEGTAFKRAAFKKQSV